MSKFIRWLSTEQLPPELSEAAEVLISALQPHPDVETLEQVIQLANDFADSNNRQRVDPSEIEHLFNEFENAEEAAAADPPPGGQPRSGGDPADWQNMGWAGVTAYFISKWSITGVAILIAVIMIATAFYMMFSGISSTIAKSDFGDVGDVRGLVAVLFSVTTVGLAIAVVVASLTLDPVKFKNMKERFEESRNILALIIGVMGTIIGFYFGSTDVADANPPLTTSSFVISDEELGAGQAFVLAGSVTGGTPPYRWSLTADGPPAGESLWKSLDVDEMSTDGTLLMHEGVAPDVQEEMTIRLAIHLLDLGGEREHGDPADHRFAEIAIEWMIPSTGTSLTPVRRRPPCVWQRCGRRRGLGRG
ncbi:MAG: hypothetical protein R3C97_09390 [Geminicoccaceae bacterium]